MSYFGHDDERWRVSDVGDVLISVLLVALSVAILFAAAIVMLLGRSDRSAIE